MDTVTFWGLLISFAGSVFLAFSVKRNPGDAHQSTLKGGKLYFAVIELKLFRLGIGLLALGILLQAAPFLIDIFYY